jgi:tetratricopeptide (TPR) repeat protein
MKRKIFLIMLGAILSLALLEAAMRAAGWAYILIQEHVNLKALQNKGTYKIMCVGESTTQWQYPKYLEEELNNRKLGIKFSVIDKGRAGCNTNFIVLNMDSDLDKYAPDMVISMMGINDGRVDVVFEEAGEKSFYKTLKVYKLARLIRSHMISTIEKVKNTKLPNIKAAEKDNKAAVLNEIHELEAKLREGRLNDEKSSVKLGDDYLNAGNAEKAEEAYKKAIEINPKCSEAYAALGTFYTYVKKSPKAEEMFKLAIKTNPGNEAGYMGLGKYYGFDNSQKAELMYRKAIERNPANGWSYEGLGDILGARGNKKEAEEMYKKAFENNNNSEMMYYKLFNLYCNNSQINGLEEVLNRSFSIDGKKTGYIRLVAKHFDKNYMDNESYLSYGTIYNYRKLRQLLEKRGVKYVCMQYPVREVNSLKKIFKGDNGIVYVDNENIFKDAVKKEGSNEYFIDMFAEDFGHCSAKGNKLIAKNIADVLSREVFIAQAK